MRSAPPIPPNLHEFLRDLAEPLTAEALFDCLPDVVYFIKDKRGEYVVVNQTMVQRCGFRSKSDILGKRADQIFPPPLGQSYRAQDESVLRRGKPILHQLEVHFYPSGGRGWCVTSKLPLFDKSGGIAGLAGVSRDLESAPERARDYGPIAKVLEYIQEHLHEALKVSTLAKRAGLSSYQLDRRIHKVFQLTTGRLIQKTRMEAALRLLLETERSIAEVALECGYSDQSAFTRTFRSATGFSPSQYRKHYRS